MTIPRSCRSLIIQVLEREKAKNLSGTQGDSAPLKETAPGWNENLAVSHVLNVRWTDLISQTDSEAHVKADQAAPTGPPSKELQDETVARRFKFVLLVE